MENIKKKIFTSVIWRFCEQFSSQIVSFLVSIVLARLLGPKEFGTIALLTIFIALSGCIVNSGFGQALIQKKDADELDFNSVFYFSIFISIVLYILLFFSAPFIAKFYSEPVLIPILRVTAIKLIFDAINSIQNAILSRKMLFSKSFIITLPSLILSGISGIYWAYKGYGVWSLAWSSLVGSISATIIRWIIIGWQPRFIFSFFRLKELFNYGSKILISGLIDTFFTQIYGLLIGKFYSSKDLGFYNRGCNIPQISMTAIQGSISSVLFPALSKEQEDVQFIKKITRKSIQSSSLLIFPTMFLLAVISKPLILILYGEKWAFATPFMQIACISYAFWHIHATNLQVVLALKRSDIFLKQEIIKKILMLICIAITIPFGVIWLALGKIILIPFSCFINSYPNIKLINYTIIEQIKDTYPSFICSICAVSLSIPIGFVLINPFLLIITQIIVFWVSFIILGYKFKTPMLNYFFIKIITFINRK